MPPEEKLYKIVEDYASQELGCDHVGQKVGTKHGIVDVVGVQELHGDFETHNEVIAIEVKDYRASFLSAVGQARSYSIYAHKCFLAYRKRYSDLLSFEEIDIASQLGIGLIEIKNKKCTVLATSASFSPRDSYVMTILNKLGLFRCAMCRAVYPLKDVMFVNQKGPIDMKSEHIYAGQMKKAIISRKNIRYSLIQLAEQRDADERKYIFDQRYLCKDCASIFASLMK